ncbi:S41 family peptidase [Flaviaesturariibacter amylovorans]|uniref:S41 family peptidase n=1 Tax=Flaviaesturariibacter amylovorans TaxID=1084520 RepID=A0ABP8HTX2_9BACT
MPNARACALWGLIGMLLCSCAARKEFVAGKKYAPETLRADYRVFRAVLEDSHPGLYWYTPRDSMDAYFRKGYDMITDSLTETRFRAVLSYVLAQVHCGHTSVRPSRAYARSVGGGISFPVNMKFWPDTALVTSNTRDSVLPRGSLITAIDGRPMNRIVDSLFQYLSGDGWNRTHLYQTLSNRGGFGAAFIPVFGYKPRYQVSFIDTLGVPRTASVNLFLPARDSARGADPERPRTRTRERGPSRRERRKLMRDFNRSLRIDAATQTAYMDLATFTKGYGLRGFFRRSFRQLKKEGVPHLVIDLRSNGGGSVTNSNLLTKYIASKPFKIADTLYAVQRNSRLRDYQAHGFWNNLFLHFMTRREKDGNYHFKYFERHYFKPRKRWHYDGQVYVLTGGNTFSAATLFAGTVRGQDNVTVVGEETGGGAYGNNAWLIPDVTLPNTGVRFRLPLFRLVIDRTQRKGYGVFPEVYAGPTMPAIRAGRDFKLEVVKEMIRKRLDTMARKP